VSGDEELAAFAARLRSLKGFAQAATEAAAPLVEAEVKRTASAGTATDGNPWPAKKDGGRALPSAADAVTAAANGAFVILKLLGPYVYHQRAKPDDHRRPILPTSAQLSSGIRAALAEGCRRAFERLSK
jgi:hypothetical protein